MTEIKGPIGDSLGATRQRDVGINGKVDSSLTSAGDHDGLPWDTPSGVWGQWIPITSLTSEVHEVVHCLGIGDSLVHVKAAVAL